MRFASEIIYIAAITALVITEFALIVVLRQATAEISRFRKDVGKFMALNIGITLLIAAIRKGETNDGE